MPRSPCVGGLYHPCPLHLDHPIPGVIDVQRLLPRRLAGAAPQTSPKGDQLSADPFRLKLMAVPRPVWRVDARPTGRTSQRRAWAWSPTAGLDDVGPAAPPAARTPRPQGLAAAANTCLGHLSKLCSLRVAPYGGSETAGDQLAPVDSESDCTGRFGTSIDLCLLSDPTRRAVSLAVLGTRDLWVEKQNRINVDEPACGPKKPFPNLLWGPPE